MTEDERVGWHHRLDGYEFEQALGDGDGQGGLVCCSPGGLQRVRHDGATEQHNNALSPICGLSPVSHIPLLPSSQSLTLQASFPDISH